jgi:DNA replication licensing factor MCM4
MLGASSPIQFPTSDPIGEDDIADDAIFRTPRAAARSHTQAHAQAQPQSSLTHNGDEPSQDIVPSEDGLVKYIWGTTISLHEAMNDFRGFLSGFKIKYRTKYNTELAQTAMEAGQVVPPTVAMYDHAGTLRGEATLYEEYLHQLRQTGQTNLNLDAVNLMAYPPTRRLYHQLCNYPQEVIPIMDQVLRDVMIEHADEELEKRQTEYAEGRYSELALRQLEDEVREVEGRVFKVRPFGGERTVNMRDLNPGGESSFESDCSVS